MKKCLLSLLLLGTALVNAQVLIDDTGTANAEPHEAAALEVRSNEKGLLVPRLDAPTAAMEVEGMIFFDSANKVFKGFNGITWVPLSEAPASPFAYNPKIDGILRDGQTVTGIYDYADPDGNEPEGTSQYEWYLAEDANGTGEIAIETTLTFDTTGWEGYFLKFCVAPVDNSNNIGDVVCTNYSEILPASLSFTETFNSITFNSSNSSSYVSVDEFVGTDNTIWNCVARTSLGNYEIDANGFMFKDKNSNYCDITFPNGIETLSFQYRSAFTSNGDRKIDVIKNGNVIGSTGTFPVSTSTTDLLPAINVNETGSVTIRISNASSKHAVIDNVTWTR